MFFLFLFQPDQRNRNSKLGDQSFEKSEKHFRESGKKNRKKQKIQKETG